MNMNPTSGGGFFTWALTGFLAALVALVIVHFIPSIAPVSTTTTARL